MDKDLKYFIDLAATLVDKEDAAIAMYSAYIDGYYEGWIDKAPYLESEEGL